MKQFVIVLCTICAVISTINGGALEDKRIKRLQRKMIKMNKLLMSVQEGEFRCNDTISSMSDTVSDITNLVEDLYKGPLLAKMDLSRGSKTTDKVLLNLPNSMERCLKSYRESPVSRKKAEINCLQQIIWRFDDPVSARRLRKAQNTVKRLARKVGGGGGGGGGGGVRPPPPAGGRRVRKEYRTLKDNERQTFHDAMNEIYADGTIADFALVHEAAKSGAHTGPAFLPWHRVFITSLEDALREKKPDVTLPYWDSTIDNSMDSPINSKLWTPDFLGNGMGDVITGAFKDWVTINGPLQRTYGEGNTKLVTKKNVENIMTQCNFADISAPNAVFSLEGPHNNVHNWVGGDMKFPATAPFDVVFYLHHAYIDYLWEKFRERQVDVCGVDPETDYDYSSTKADHHFDDQLLLQNYTVSEGMANFWTQSIFSYEDTPSCENNCGNSDHLYCPAWKGCCIPRPRFQGPTDITFPFPGGDTTTTHDMSFVDASTTHCDHYLDPHCHHEHSMLKGQAGIPLQPALELKLLEDMVPVNRGPQFQPDNPSEVDTRTLLTLKHDIERGVEERKSWERTSGTA